MQHRTLFVVTTTLICLTVLASQAVMAHGETDEKMLAEFQNHLDDYEGEIGELITDVEAIVGNYVNKKTGKTDVDALIEHWEEVNVHAAIETKAMITYPGVWQAVMLLKQSVDESHSIDKVVAAGERAKAALWQAYGAVRLAANQVQNGLTPVAVDYETPASGPETVEQIIADLEKAVAEYRADNLAGAEALIHQTYMTRFEGLEGDLIARDPDLVSNLEKDFNATLPLLMQQGASLDDVQATLASMKKQLQGASSILESIEASRSEVF